MACSKGLREYGMKRCVGQEERSQIILFPERLDAYVNEDNPVRVVDVFVEGLYLAALGFEGVTLWRQAKAVMCGKALHEHRLTGRIMHHASG
jgi:hypothetical protein